MAQLEEKPNGEPTFGLKAGYVVRLKSGGPLMTIDRKGQCYWFDSDGLSHQRFWPLECLERLQPGGDL